MVICTALICAGLIAFPAAALLDDRGDARAAGDAPVVRVQAVAGAISPHQEPAPELFEATGTASWDGKRTLQGIWVAHPLATTARRARIYNTANGAAVDGALFKRDEALSGSSVLVSSEAAQLLGMSPGDEVDLRIVALRPSRRPRVEPTEPAAVAAATAAPTVVPDRATAPAAGPSEQET